MRDLSLSVRIVVLAVLLPTVAAICVVALVMADVLHPRIAHMAAAGGAILIVAALAAAISALGPKYRPTPLLTPLFAGVLAALLSTVAVYAAHSHIAPKHTVVAAVETKPTGRPIKTAPVIEKAAIEPDLAATPQQPLPGPPLIFGTGGFAPPAEPLAKQEVERLPQDEADSAAIGGPLVSVASAAEPPAQAAEKPVAAAAADGAEKPPVAMAAIPAAAAAPEAEAKADADAPLDLSAPFDPSGPSEPQAEGPPMALAAGGAAPAAGANAAIPPLPRIRPCGGAGRACP